MVEISFLQGVLLLAVIAAMAVALAGRIPMWFGYVAAVLMASYYLAEIIVFGPSWPRAGLVVVSGTIAAVVWWRGLRRGPVREQQENPARDT